MKKLLLLLVCLMSLTAVSCSGDYDIPEDSMLDGTFYGVGDGRNGQIVVALTVSGHEITDIKIVSHAELPFAIPALEQIVAEVLSKQTTEGVDAVSGASLTSAGLLQALTNAINASRGIYSDEEDYSDCSCDIVVVGAGGAGLSAAIEAHSLGKNVIVLEKMGIVGGNTNYSTGGINAAGTEEQAELGIEDSPELHFNDTMAGGHYYNDPDLVHTFTGLAAAAVKWLKSLGADLSDVGKMAGSSVPRSHRPKGGSAIGSHLVKVLKDNTLNDGIPIRLRNEVTSLLTDVNGTVTGVEVSTAKGSYKITAKAVIIATGGFGSNAALIGKFCPELKDFPTSNHPGATGDALEWIEAVQADTTQMAFIQTHPTGDKYSHILITEAVRGNGAILVNREGVRFANEMITRDSLSAAILAQEGKSAFIVFGESVRKSLAVIETYISQGLVKQSGSLDGLASITGLPSAALVPAVEKYNHSQESGVDGEFGRLAADMPRPIDPPYYAIEVEPLIHHTMGGIKIDTKARVLHKDGSPVKGLYAAGEVTGGVHGDNRLGGNAVADIIIFGRIAADTASEEMR